MTKTDLSMLSSCINADPFTEEQFAFLSRWYIPVSDAQVDDLNSRLPSLFGVSALETKAGAKVLPSFIITDEHLYAAIIEDLRGIKMIELSPEDFKTDEPEQGGK